jgi:predicted nucleotidyltransferase
MISNQILDEVARRIVENFHPEKIILFGSQARGTADSHSDVDILVISAIKEKRRKLMVDMRSVLNELEYAFDLIILTREEFERDRKIPGTVGRYASKEGKVIYEHS